MKKTYIVPTSDVVEIGARLLLQESMKPNGSQTITNQNQFLSPDYEGDEDEDEEDW